MKCPKCGKQNPDDVKVCSECNTLLPGSVIANHNHTPEITTWPQTSDFAIASPILGIFGIILFHGPGILVSITGFIFGGIACIKIYRHPNRLKGGALALAGISLSLIGLSLACFIFLPKKYQEYQRVKYYHCAAKLGKIGYAMRSYSDDFNDSFPPDLKTLVTAKYADSEYIVCPGSSDPNPQYSYIYRGGDLSSNHSSQLIVAYDKYEIHDTMRNVLFADFSIKGMTEAEFQKAIEIDNQYRRQLGLPEKSLEQAVSSETD